jgi:hypothetical protein
MLHTPSALELRATVHPTLDDIDESSPPIALIAS